MGELPSIAGIRELSAPDVHSRCVATPLVSSYLTFSPLLLREERFFSSTRLSPRGLLPIKKRDALRCPDFPHAPQADAGDRLAHCNSIAKVHISTRFLGLISWKTLLLQSNKVLPPCQNGARIIFYTIIIDTMIRFFQRFFCLACFLLCTATLPLSLWADGVWGTTNVRYAFQSKQPVVGEKSLTLTAWAGETVNAQLVLRNATSQEVLYRTVLQRLKGKGKEQISPKEIALGYVDEVIADTFSSCGKHEVERYGRFMQADRITAQNAFVVPQGQQRGVWLSIAVPRTQRPGRYKGQVIILRNEKIVERLSLTLHVQPRLLPEASKWQFHLDFWQNPYAIARWHQLQPWTYAHFEAMRPYMKMLANGGQKVVTATLINRPWDGQTYDAFGSMVQWVKRADGTWHYDFSIFDRWVQFMDECGIRDEITCFSMIPWRLSFQYYDEASQSFQEWKGAPGDSIYSERWGHFLSAFAAHLKEKGWFSKTTIAMDERPMPAMRHAIAIIHQAAPGLKISMAGYYHPEIEADLFDYCIDEQSPEQPTPAVLERRRREGKTTTYYTCCSSRLPNTFTFSPPAEAAAIPWYALQKGMDGYLRWAYNSWTIDPERDSRFTAWSSGDTYIVYPKANPSVRWAKLIEGIQQVEKFRLLLAEAKQTGNVERIATLENLLKRIDVTQPETTTMVQAELNALSAK